jgi:hypothetical protein
MASVRRHTVAFMGSQVAATVEVEFYCPDPRFLSALPNTIASSSPPGPTVFHATVSGNARTYPILTMTGTLSGPSMTIQPPDGSTQVIYLVDLSAGSSVDVWIDCDPKNRDSCILLSDLTPRLDYLYFVTGGTGSVSRLTSTNQNPDMLPYLLPGDNVITLENYGSGGPAEFTWRDAWL